MTIMGNCARKLLWAAFFAVLAGMVSQRSFAEDTAGSNEIKWQLDGMGEKVTAGVLTVTGGGTGSSYWRSEPVPVQSGEYYRFSVSHRGVDSEGGCLPCGLEGFSRDYRTRPNQWTEESFYFRPQMRLNVLPQTSINSAQLKVGQWESKGTFQFRDAKLEKVVPIWRIFGFPFGMLWLGEGETVRDGKYRFNGDFSGTGSNTHAPFQSSNTSFNSNRWCFGENSFVSYRFRLASCPFNDVKLSVNVCYHAQGEGLIEISTDHENWAELAKIDKVGTKEISLFPAETIHLRIRGLKGANFQVDRIGFEATLPEVHAETDMRSINLNGETYFAVAEGGGSIPISLSLALAQNNEIMIFENIPTTSGNVIENTTLVPLKISRSPGEMKHSFEYQGRKYSYVTQTHPLERSDYGYLLPSNRMASPGTFWWCEADWKVSRDRLPPAAAPETTKPIRINAAKNDVEGFQFVVRANDDAPIKGLTGSVSKLEGPNGAVIPAENVELLYAYYHFVHSKTDGTGKVGYWPDALPPLDRPIDVAAAKNQPIWLNVKVPADAVAGDYRGTFRLKSANGRFDVSVPYTLHVWDFALPEENHLETAFGYNPGLAAKYHNVQTEEDRRRVHETYLQCFSDHRISIYNPAPFDGISVEWLPKENPPRCEIDFTRFDAEMDRVLKKFHFTNFTVPGHGLGGGTFHSRVEPSIAGFAAETPEYKAMIAEYYQKLQAHLIEKGWIKKANIYWFDEPGEHDYEFVAEGTAKLEKYGPKIQRFMTLMMDNDGFLKTLDAKNTSINIWCPVSNSFREDLAAERMKLGERFWWYVCTGPKAPYCTLFLDHPATELRVWQWQAWERNIVGSLIWESTYWNSTTAFPGGYQNPYEDPMGYTVGYSVPSGTKQHWGNGDGRFIYPPLAAAVPGLNDGKPVFEKPVSSIRWEMIREGIEDYEMLYMLRELLKEKADKLPEADRVAANELLNVPDSITKSMTEFTIDPRPILERRTEIAEMIEKLNAMK